MATVVDALVVTLGLDPKDFTKGQKQAAAEILKTRQAAEKHGKGIEKSMDGAAEAADRLARTALKLFAVFTAGRAVKQFTTEITDADAALGRLAKSISSTPEAISSLANAVARNGGSAGAAAGSFERLSDSINEIKTTGSSSILPYLYRLQGLGGKTINLNKDLADSFGDIAENAKNVADRQGVSFATYLLKQAGIDRDTAALFVQGRDKLNEAIEKSRKIGIVKKEDTEAAQKLQTSIEGLRQTSESLGRGIMTGLTPTITRLLTQFQDWIDKNRGIISTRIAEYVERLAKWIEGIDWGAVGKGLEEFGAGAKKVADQFGGVLRICEALFLFWVGSKALAIVSSILKVAGLLSAGPLGWAIRLAIAGSVASDLAVPNAEKPGVITRSDDENSGAAVGPSGATGDGGFGRDRGRVRRWWGRNMPTWLGGGEDGLHTRAGRGGAKLPGNVGIGGWWTADRQKHAIDTLVKGGVSELGARALVARWSAVEAPGGPTSVNPKSGAYGIGQWLTKDRRLPIQGNGDFDAQLQYALKELHGPEGRALKALNSATTPMEAARGASIYERAEGWNAAAGTDNFTGRTAAAMDKLVGGGTASAKTATSATGNPDGSPLPTDGTGVNNDLMRVVKRAQEISAVRFHVHEGLRTIERQAEMYKRGWSKTMNSKHLTGRAVDLRADGDPAVGALDPAKYAKINEAMKKAAGELGVPVQWGGDSFGKFKDVPHFQLPDGFKSNAGAYGVDPAKVSALGARQAGAVAAMAQVQAAQAAQAAMVSNDNRTVSTSTSDTTFNGGINISVPGGDSTEIARNMEGAIRRRAFASAANYARA